MSAAISRALRIAAALVAVAALGLASYAAARFFWVEQLVEGVTLPRLEKAVQLAPSHSNAWARIGALRERLGDSAGAAAALERSVALNRYNSGAWVDLGLHWEAEGDTKRAEQCLLEAVRVDAQYFPRWSLANFYLRQQRGEPFWAVMREAISSNKEDLTPAFSLYWRAFTDPDQILDKGIPDEPDINRRYFHYLRESARTPALARVWKRIEYRLEPIDLETGLQYTDLLVENRQVEGAVEAWNRLVQTGLLKLQKLDPAEGRVLTNGSFVSAPSAMGFDWAWQKVDGVRGDVEIRGKTNVLHISFNGAHPEETGLLGQWAPVEAGRGYRLRFRYATAQLPPDTGLYWSVKDAAAEGTLAAGRVLTATQELEWLEDGMTFQTGPKTRMIRLTFGYRRSPGTTRAAGSVLLSEVELSPWDKRAGISGGPAGVRP